MDIKNYLQDQSDILSALGHPARVEILEILREEEACVCHIQAVLDQRQAYISQHLNILKRAGLVQSRKDGLRVYYRASSPDVYGILDGVQSALRALGKEPPAGYPAQQTDHACTCPQCCTDSAAERINNLAIEEG